MHNIQTSKSITLIKPQRYSERLCTDHGHALPCAECKRENTIQLNKAEADKTTRALIAITLFALQVLVFIKIF